VYHSTLSILAMATVVDTQAGIELQQPSKVTSSVSKTNDADDDDNKSELASFCK
jgi:hypothetical protein